MASSMVWYWSGEMEIFFRTEVISPCSYNVRMLRTTVRTLTPMLLAMVW